MLQNLILLSFLAGRSVKAQNVDGIYPVSGDGTGLFTIYGDNLETVTDIRFRSELIQGNWFFLGAWLSRLTLLQIRSRLLHSSDIISAGDKPTISGPLHRLFENTYVKIILVPARNRSEFSALIPFNYKIPRSCSEKVIISVKFNGT